MAEVARLLQEAVGAQRSGRMRDAIAHFEAVIAIAPDNAVALNSLGVHAMETGNAARACELLQKAVAIDPKAAPLWMNLAKAQRLIGNDEGEQATLQRVLEIDQRDFMALIRLAELHQRRGENAQAMTRWSGVLALAAGMQGRTAELDAVLAGARKFVERQSSGFAEAIDAGLKAEREALGGTARRRFDRCLESALGRRKVFANHCEGLFYPFLPADEFFDRAHFSWMAAIEARTPVIRAEAEALLAGGGEGFAPYVTQLSGTPHNIWTNLDGSTDWSAYYLWQYGKRNDAACAACPETAAALDAMPLQDIADKSPTAFFSLLRPHTRIPPHTGVTNTRAIVHLPLIVPEECGFRVGGETRDWQEGTAFAFDDTIEHEAWNDSDSPRLVLIFDVWNPHLLDAERTLLRSFFTVAGSSGYDPNALTT